MKKLINTSLLASLLLGSAAWASVDTEAYCTYVQEKAGAERVALQSSQLMANVGRANSSGDSLLAIGLGNSLARYNKGTLSFELGQRDCALYSTRYAIEQHLRYARDVIQRDALMAKKMALLEGKASMMASVISLNGQVLKQTATVLDAYQKATALARIDNELTAIEVQLALTEPHELTGESLSKMVGGSLQATQRYQQTVLAISKQDNWDVALTVGMQHPLNNTLGGSNAASPYAAIVWTYSLGSSSHNLLLAKTSEAYLNWQKSEQTGQFIKVTQFKHQLLNLLTVKSQQLSELQTRDVALQTLLEKMDKVQTESAVKFHAQLVVDALFLKAEAVQVSTEVTGLQQYVTKNFRP
ncbi:MAG: hypothetical protein Q7S87_10405 [Agitococcus sp.]|nr:hypothetical protein [Agitococcus sp.]MDO9179460.1 hypothetical protein [Agitococcus sp.]